jgi:hypothetical protein
MHRRRIGGSRAEKLTIVLNSGQRANYISVPHSPVASYHHMEIHKSRVMLG